MVGSPLAIMERSYSISSCFRNGTMGSHVNGALIGFSCGDLVYNISGK